MRWAADAQLRAAQERRAENEAVLAAALQESQALQTQLEVERAKAERAKAEASKATLAAEEASKRAAASEAERLRAEAEERKAVQEAKVDRPCGPWCAFPCPSSNLPPPPRTCIPAPNMYSPHHPHSLFCVCHV
jgi:hypothetical protein